MLRFMSIPNKEKFLNLIEACQGSVLLHLPDNTTRDLKSDPTAREMLKLLPSNGYDLGLSFSDSCDSSVFLRYMMAASHG